MFGTKNGGTAKNAIDTLIGVNTKIEGNITFRGGLRIDGEVCGNISCEEGQQGTLVISEKATVEGAVRVGHVVINGTVIGPVSANETLELLSAARVTGDVEYQQIEIQQGAVVEGRLVHLPGARNVELKLASNSAD